MKNNVDLTENMIFSRNASVSYDNDLTHSIIITGNREERKNINFYRQIDNENYCDCCGQRMNLKPWIKEIGICHQCDAHYLKQKDKCLWRRKEWINTF